MTGVWGHGGKGSSSECKAGLEVPVTPSTQVRAGTPCMASSRGLHCHVRCMGLVAAAALLVFCPEPLRDGEPVVMGQVCGQFR